MEIEIYARRYIHTRGDRSRAYRFKSRAALAGPYEWTNEWARARVRAGEPPVEWEAPGAITPPPLCVRPSHDARCGGCLPGQPLFSHAHYSTRVFSVTYIFSRAKRLIFIYIASTRKKTLFLFNFTMQRIFFRLKWKHVFPLMIQMIFCIKAINKAVVLEFIKIISGTITDMIFNNAVFFFSKSWKR